MSIKKQPITATLKALSIGETTIFPRTRADVVSQIASRIGVTHDYKFSRRTKEDGIYITRIK